jgi:anti-sigma factor RsiW
MSDCRDISEALPAYADDVLGPEERQRVERHLKGCATCRKLAADEDRGRSLLRHHAAKLLDEPLPSGLRSRCEVLAQVRKNSLGKVAAYGPWWRVRLVPVLLTAVVMIFTASAFLSLATRRSDALLAAQLTADHSKCFKLLAPSEGASIDARSIEQMLSEQYGWSGRVPSSSPQDDIQLVGARRCLYGDGIVPHVMYKVHGQDVSLFVLPGKERKPDDVVTLGHRSQIWSREGTTFVLVSAADAGDLEGAAQYVKREARETPGAGRKEAQ